VEVVERIFEQNLAAWIYEGKGTTDAIFIVRRMQEKFTAKVKK